MPGKVPFAAPEYEVHGFVPGTFLPANLPPPANRPYSVFSTQVTVVSADAGGAVSFTVEYRETSDGAWLPWVWDVDIDPSGGTNFTVTEPSGSPAAVDVGPLPAQFRWRVTTQPHPDGWGPTSLSGLRAVASPVP